MAAPDATTLSLSALNGGYTFAAIVTVPRDVTLGAYHEPALRHVARLAADALPLEAKNRVTTAATESPSPCGRGLG